MCVTKRIDLRSITTIFSAARASLNPSTLPVSVGNTLVSIAICLLVAIPIGSLLAILTLRTNAFCRRLAGIVLASQLAVPLYVFAGGWAAGIGLQGWLQMNYWLGPTGVGWMQSWFGSMLAVALIHAFACVPWVSLIISMGLLTCDRSEEEMALVEGGWTSLVRYVWFPRLRIWLCVACLWCAMGLLTEIVVSNLFMFPTVAELVYMDVSRGTTSPLTYVASIALCALPVVLVGLWISRGLPSLAQVLTKPQHHQSMAINLGNHRWIASALMWSLLLGLVGLPILNIFMKSGWTPLTDGQQVIGHSWTIRRFLQTVVESLTLFQSEFYWSILLSLGSMSVALTISCLLRWMTRDRSVADATNGSLGSSRTLVHVLMLLLVATPGPLVGVLMTLLLNRPGPVGTLYTTTLIAPILAQQFRLLPLAWLMICGLVASIPRQTWELSRADRLSAWLRLKTVLIPSLWKRFSVAAVILVLVSLGELSCSMGVLPPGVTTISMRLFEILHFGMRHQDSGLCGVLIVMGWLAAILMQRATRTG
jgi:iron(III) transport system permease protein